MNTPTFMISEVQLWERFAVHVTMPIVSQQHLKTRLIAVMCRDMRRRSAVPVRYWSVGAIFDQKLKHERLSGQCGQMQRRLQHNIHNNHGNKVKLRGNKTFYSI